MSSSANTPADPGKLPVPYRPRPGRPDLAHHTNEWTSGSQGGGSVPTDFEWPSNPKQHQEERGAGEAERPIS